MNILKVIQNANIKIAFVTDSLSMQRGIEAGNIPLGHTYPSIVSNFFKSSIDLKLFQMYGMTIDIAADIITKNLNFDILFVHVGVVDCYPRVFSREDNTHFSKISPQLRGVLQNFVKQNRSEIISKLGNIVYTEEDEFKAQIEKIFTAAQKSNMQIIFANIINAKQSTPFLNENIIRYNTIIRTCAEIYSQHIFDANSISKRHGGYKEMLLPDNHHLSLYGNKIFAEKLIEKLFEIILRYIRFC